jgi:hypothetical protein
MTVPTAPALVALYVPVSRENPLRLVELPGFDTSLPGCDEALRRMADATRAYVGDTRGGFFDGIVLHMARDETARTTLSVHLPDDGAGQRNNEWWHAAGAGLTWQSGTHRDIRGPLLVAAETTARDENATARSLSVTDWRDPSGRTHGAEEWTDASVMLRQLCKLACGKADVVSSYGSLEDALAACGMSPTGGSARPAVVIDVPHDETPQCASCMAASASLRMCSACRAVRYCSVECQHAHWKKHKKQCRNARAQA